MKLYNDEFDPYKKGLQRMPGVMEDSTILVATTIISNVGFAKSLVMEALYAAKDGNFDLAQKKLEESNRYFVDGHRAHAALIRKEASGESVEIPLLLMHAEDQLLNTETMSELVKEMIEMYQRFNK